MERETEAVIEKMCALHPEFKEALADPDTRDLILVFSDFGDILVRESARRTPDAFSTLFVYLEDCYINGTPQVRSAVATCLYESLLDAADKSPEQMRPLMQHLGPKSREYCLQLNAMHGIKRVPW